MPEAPAYIAAMAVDPVQYLLAARNRLAIAQLELRRARISDKSFGATMIDYAELRVKQRLDEVWTAQLAAAADLIVVIGIDHAVRLGLGWGEE